MPIYEFACSKCQTVFELLVRSAAEELCCPECKAPKPIRQLSVIAAPAVASPNNQAAAVACEQPRCCGGGCQPF